MALAFRILRSPRRVYTLIGDGESNEGTVWESVMVATNLRLNNLTILYDNNKSQIRSLPIPNPTERFVAFKCETHEVDGHNLDEIKAALAKPSSTVKVIVCNTVKGYGSTTLANNIFEWHRKSPDAQQFEQFIKELEAA